MCKIKRIIFLVCLLLTSVLQAQDQIEVFFDKSDRLLTSIEVQTGQTMYGIARQTGNSVNYIMALNDRVSHDLSIGETLLAPFRGEIVAIDKMSDTSQKVIYKVSKGDNLFRISQLTGISLAQLKSHNEKSDAHLSIGEEVTLGWLVSTFEEQPTLQQRPLLSIRPLPLKFNQSISSLSPQNSLVLPGITHHFVAISNESVTERGIAYWEKRDYEGQALIVMHPRARLNSDISLYNPMLNRTVTAKVVRELPREAYPEDISVVISPSVASALGALDKRFLVEITYVE